MSYIVLFELPTHSSGTGTGPLFSPNTWTTRLTLLHMNLPFRVVELDGPSLRHEYFTRVFGKRPLVPMIEVPDDQTCADLQEQALAASSSASQGHENGSVIGGPEFLKNRPGPQERGGRLVMDTMIIARTLHDIFPKLHSPFVPERSASEASISDLRAGANWAHLLKRGLGNSESRWSWHFELLAPAIAANMDPRVRTFFKSDEKNGKGGWQKLLALDRGELLARTRRSLRPISHHFSNPVPFSDDSAPPLFLQSPTRPGLSDAVIFGRYAMSAATDSTLSKAIWAEDPKVAREWFAANRRPEDAELPVVEGEWDGDITLPGLQGWIDRMMDWSGGHARSQLSQEQRPRAKLQASDFE
ncbi:Thioredoxin-like fold [Ceraceosorus bombacis]|uniref:Thioredoxin-like fold n=1 Tax=Ceraceosorus bombacis TaxID=401625 RepID=A0A0P1BIH0_9BASI|nr:Thioredoxin-like fold [Ceraceosorus bombacis]